MTSDTNTQNMSKADRKRLEKIQEDATREVKLTYPDLLLLLAHDPDVRARIQAMAAAPAPACAAQPVAATWQQPEPAPQPEPEPELPPEPEPEPEPDPLREELNAQLHLLEQVRDDPELARHLLHAPADASQGAQLVRLVARAAQWQSLWDLWEILAQRCKDEQRPAHATERAILAGCLAIHNQVWDGRQASLLSVPPGGRFDFQQHERATTSGDTILAEWLPGLRNAGNNSRKNPLLATA